MDTIKLIANIILFPGGIFAILFSLFMTGLDRKIYARLQRRVGPPLHQPMIDIIKLSQKEILIPRTANQTAFRLAPLIGFAGMIAAIATIPIAGVYSGLYQSMDLIVLLYLLTTPALAIMIGASASGSPYSSVGLSREMTMILAYEIPLLLVILTVGMRVGMAGGGSADFSLTNIVDYQITNGPLLFDLPMLPAFLAFLICIPGTMGVVPFDIPEAETEIAEGTLLEYSGSGLAMFKLVGGLKLIVVSAMAVALFFPNTLGSFWLVNLLWFILKCIVVTLVTITFVRATRSRMRLDQAFRFYLTIPAGLALISLILTVFSVRI